MQVCYTEAEIMFIEALFIFEEQKDRNDQFYEKVGRTISQLKKACKIANSGGYKEQTSTSKFLQVLNTIYNKFKMQHVRYPSGDSDVEEPTGSDANYENQPIVTVYTSGFENLSSAGIQSTDSDNENLCKK